MGGTYQHIKHFLDFRGLDLRSSEVLRPPGFSSDVSKNTVHSPQGAITSRWGHKRIAQSGGMYGLATYETTDILGVSKTELIGVGNTDRNAYLCRLARKSFTITNANAAAATVYFFYDDSVSKWRFRVSRGGSDILDLQFTTTATTLSTLETAVDAVSGLAMSTPSVTSTPATYLELINASTIAGSGGSLTLYYWTWEQLAFGTSGTSNTAYECGQRLAVGSESFRPCSFAQLGGVLYVGSQGTKAAPKYLLKYDGNRVYAAGLPAAAEEEAASVTLGNVASPYASTTDIRGDQTFTSAATIAFPRYRMRYVNVDKAGNRVESEVIDLGDSSAGAIQEAIVGTTGSIYNNPYNKAFAIVSATATSLSVSVTSGHKMQAGDIAYFWDALQARFIQREITATGATSLTLSAASLDSDPGSLNYDTGATPRLLDDALITNNARIAFFRTADSAQADYYLMDEVPNWHVDSGLSAYRYVDTVADTTALERASLVEDAFPHSPPPKNCHQISAYNDGLILSGDPGRPRTAFFSDVDGREYFPAVTHNFELTANVTGHRQSGEFLVCGTALSLHVTSGVLPEFNFRFDKIGENIGIQSHTSMAEIDEGVLCFDSNVGPQVLVAGRSLAPLGYVETQTANGGTTRVSRLLPFWTRKYGDTEEKPVFARSLAVVVPDDKLYVLFVPYEDPAKPSFSTSNTVAWVYDYGRDTWHKWTGVDGSGGATVLSKVPYFTSRAHDGDPGTDHNRIFSVSQQQQRAPAVGKYGYADHDAAITWVDRKHWESLGEPDLYKRFLRCRISSHETRLAASTVMKVRTYLDIDAATVVYENTLTWASQRDLKIKLSNCKCRAMMIEFEQTTRYNPMIISGYTLEAVASFRPEMKE